MRTCRAPQKGPKKKLKKFHKTYIKPGSTAVKDEDEAARKNREKNFVYPIRTPIKHKSFLVLDLETKKKDEAGKGFERPFLACVYDGDEYKSFRNDERHKGRSYEEEFWHEPGGCIDRMMRHIFGLRACEECGIAEGEDRFGSCKDCLKARRRYQSKKWTIYAHNFGKFDGLYVLGWIRRHENLFRFETIMVQSRMLILTIFLKASVPGRGKEERWTFSDSIALIPLSLKEIGKTFFSDRDDAQKIGFDLDLPEDHPDWEAYNDRDNYVLHEALSRFRDLVEKIGGSIGMTAASTAMQIYRRKFQTEIVHWPSGFKQPKPIVISRNPHMPDCDGRCHKALCPHDACQVEPGECHGCLHDFVRQGFFGGRTEIYTLHGEDLFYYDLNSSYPASMLKDMPVGRARVLKEGTPIRSLEMMNEKNIGFVECVVYIPEDCYLPPLPYRYVTAGGSRKLIFPVGTLYGVWNWEELQLLKLVGGRILEVGKSVWYQRKKIFVDFVHTLYAYRKHKKTCPTYSAKDAKCVCGYDEGMSFVAKLIMNSLYGKWGMNPLREKLLYLDLETLGDPDFDLQLGILPPPGDESLPLRIQHAVDADYIVPQISATITAYSRITYFMGLHKAIQETSKPIPNLRPQVGLRAGQTMKLPENIRKSLQGAPIVYVDGVPRLVNKGTLIYGDTDSCTATVRMKPEGSELGQWKLEEEHIDMEVEQPKFYHYSRHKEGCRRAYCEGGCKKDKYGETNKTRMKGVPRMDVDGNSMQTRVVFDHLRGKVDHTGELPTLVRSEGGTPELSFPRLMAAKSMLRHDRTSPVMEDIRRSMQSVYDKRVVFPDGTTMPLILDDPTNIVSARMVHRLREAA